MARRNAAQPGFFAFSICFITYHCCASESTWLTTQYSTRPAGKKKNITPKISGMNIITLAWTGSGGVGFSLYWIHIRAK